MRTVADILTTLAVVGLVSLVAVEAAADEEDGDAGEVGVEVRTIVATPDGEEFDSELDDLRGRLERGFEDYSSFRQLDRQRRSIDGDAGQDFELPTDDRLTLSYQGRDDDYVRLGLELEERLSTTVRATPGSTFFQAGLEYDEGLLILAITVE